MLQPQLLAELGTRYEAVAHRQGLRGFALGTAVVGLPVVVVRRHDDFGEFALAPGLDHAPTVIHRNAIELHVTEHAQSIEKQLRLVQQRQAFLGNLAEGAGFIDTDHFRPGCVQLAGHQRQQGTSTGNHRAAQWFDHAALDLQLQATEQQHTGQCPTRKRHIALMATGRQHQLRVVNLMQTLFAIEHHQTLFVTAYHAAVEAQVDVPGTGGEFLVQRVQGLAVARAQIPQVNACAQRSAIHHPTRPRRLIEQHTGYTVMRQLNGCRHTCRTTTDNHWTQTHGASCPAKRLLRVSTCIPGWTTVWQARRLGRPLIETRQQWHTPMPQKAPLSCA
ncbi:hypothetical protein D9M71_308800 [compost metagenome]